MQIGPFWLITIGTINGPWHVASHGRAWYIVNKNTGICKRIGPFRIRGKNWHDTAVDEAKRRNRLLGFPQTSEEADWMLLSDTKDKDLGLITDRIQTAEGEAELKRRIAEYV